MIEVVIPYAPRTLQRTLHNLADAHRYGTIVTHRRFGKTVFAVNHLEKHALISPKPRPRFGHIFPTYRQGKAVGWDYAKHYGLAVPGAEPNETELRIDFPNDGQYRIFGADTPDSLRGLYFDGVIFDEYGIQPPRIFTEVVRPALSDRQGWAMFMGTPNGKNQFYEAKQAAMRNESGDWFFAEYRASETGILSAAELADNRAQMTEDEYDQEYECSFEASVKGAVFAREMILARAQGRITRVPYDPALPVDTDWDLGVGDSTAIWFSQTLYSGEVRLIDYYEASGAGLDHYKRILNERGYAYGTHWAPHDIQVRELSSGHSRLEAARALGINFRLTPKGRLEDGIYASRALLAKCWFDSDKAQRGIEALTHYRWDYNARIQEHTHMPVHDWSSHGADAFRGLAMRHRVPQWNPERVERELLKKAQQDYDEPHPSTAVRKRGGFSRPTWGRRAGYRRG